MKTIFKMICRDDKYGIAFVVEKKYVKELKKMLRRLVMAGMAKTAISKWVYANNKIARIEG